jgi:hypothetical protein
MSVSDDPEPVRHRQIDVLERLRDPLFSLEQGEELSTEMHERLHETLLRTDREIEALR